MKKHAGHSRLPSKPEDTHIQWVSGRQEDGYLTLLGVCHGGG